VVHAYGISHGSLHVQNIGLSKRILGQLKSEDKYLIECSEVLTVARAVELGDVRLSL
jgi:hypothetical protein